MTLQGPSFRTISFNKVENAKNLKMGIFLESSLKDDAGSVEAKLKYTQILKAEDLANGCLIN